MQNVFMAKQVASQQSWLEPTQSAKDQSTNCDNEKNTYEWNCKIQTAKCNYKSEMEWSTFAEPLSREIYKKNSRFHQTIRQEKFQSTCNQ